MRAEELDAGFIFRCSRKFDLVYKIRLASAWASGDGEMIRRAGIDYLEMQRARFGFFENSPRRTCPKDFIDSFRNVADSIRAGGFSNDANPVQIDEHTFELIAGHHRLACCIAYGRPCRFAYGVPKRRDKLIATFRTFREGKMATSVENRGVRAYLELNPNARVFEIATREDEETAIAGFERKFSGTVWHSKKTDDGFAFTVSWPRQVPDTAPARELSIARAKELFAEEEDPDWRTRAVRESTWRYGLERIRYRLTMPFRSGRRRSKAEWHIAELRCRETAYARLADYLESERWV